MSITGYIVSCVVWKFFFQKATIEAAEENELSAVILFIQYVSLPAAVYFKAFQSSANKRGFSLLLRDCAHGMKAFRKQCVLVVGCCRILT